MKSEVEEERWLDQLLAICTSEAITFDVMKFMETIWRSPLKSAVLSSGIAAEQLSCGRWLSCDLVESVFEMLNLISSTHHFAVCSEAVIHSLRAKQRLIGVICNKLSLPHYLTSL